jgi:long-chain fatty acid transport protein
MRGDPMWRGGFARVAVATLATLLLSGPAQAGNGYFILGYGPLAHQSAGTATAMGLDGFAGASNPAKLAFTDPRLDLGVLSFMPYRRIERRGASNPVFDISSTSRNSYFPLPELGYVQRLDPRWSAGVAVYGNGGLNTEYPDSTGVEGTNANPAKCGDRPGNFFLGCGKLGFDLSQLIVAPTLAWQVTPKHSLGVSPLLVYQRFKAYGFQAFEALSAHPDAVSNRGYDDAFGAGVRVGWFARPAPWIDVGAAYAMRIHMDKFDKYRGLIADGGEFDVPANFSVGFALRPAPNWTVGADIQRIFYGDLPALSNGALASIEDTDNRPFGSRGGSGFNWRNLTNYKVAVAWQATSRWTLRAGYLYGRRPAADDSADSVSFNMFAPNPRHQFTTGFTWVYNPRNEVQFAYGRYVHGTYQGPSATAALGVGGTEKITPHVDTVLIGWTRKF